MEAMVSTPPLCCSRSRGGFHSSRKLVAVLLLPLLAQSLLMAVAAPTQQGADTSSKSVTILGVREQCGGLLWSGTLRSGVPMDAPYPQVECAKGLKCHRDSKWYFECVPETDDSAWKLETALSGHAASKDKTHAEADMLDVMDQAMNAKGPHQASVAEYLQKKLPQVVRAADKLVREQVEVVERKVADVMHKQQQTKVQEAASAEYEVKLARTLSAWSRKRKLQNNQAPDDTLYNAVGVTPDMLEQYGQCGGKINAPEGVDAVDAIWKKNTSGEVKCWPGWACKRVNEWYWQCQPIPPPPRPPTFIEVAGTKKLILDPWAQCGGKGGQVPDDEQPVDGPYPGKICFANTDCTRQNEWYWQCLPNKNFGGTSGGGGGDGSGDGGPAELPSPPMYSPPPPASIPQYYSSPSPAQEQSPPVGGDYGPTPSGYPSGYPTGYPTSTYPGGTPAGYTSAQSPPVFNGRRRLTLEGLSMRWAKGVEELYEDV